tara:strand:+ start:806 stop:1249 length:444 start_codon:yes stop_codon:yes gene_type:complete
MKNVNQELVKQGYTYRSISEMTGISKSKVGDIIKTPRIVHVQDNVRDSVSAMQVEKDSRNLNDELRLKEIENQRLEVTLNHQYQFEQIKDDLRNEYQQYSRDELIKQINQFQEVLTQKDELIFQTQSDLSHVQESLISKTKELESYE